MSPSITLLALTAFAVPVDTWLPAPTFEGGSELRVSAAGHVDVRELGASAPRWSLGMGGPVQGLAVDSQRIYVASGRFLRAVAGGETRWAVELAEPATGLELEEAGLRVDGPRGSTYVRPESGAMCGPSTPCAGLPGPAWPSQWLGVPFLDLSSLGFPGVSLMLWDLGETGWAAGPAPGWMAQPPPPPAAPKVREMQGGLPSVRLGLGRGGKVRTFSAGVGAAPILREAEAE